MSVTEPRDRARPACGGGRGAAARRRRATAAWGIAARAQRADDGDARDARAGGADGRGDRRRSAARPQQEIVLPGTMQAFTDAAIFARTNGYLQKRYADIGARVKRGPAAGRDRHARGRSAAAAGARRSRRPPRPTRGWRRRPPSAISDLIKTDSVSQQDLDNAVGGFEAQAAPGRVGAGQRQRLEQLQAFSRIYAPFDGVITARNTDIGALIDSGSGAQGAVPRRRDRSRCACSSTCRRSTRRRRAPGWRRTLTLQRVSRAGTFTGTLARTAQSIDVASRTLLTEIDVDNPKGELLPGAYAEVAPQAADRRVDVPAAGERADLPRRGLQVATVQGGHVVAAAGDARARLRHHRRSARRADGRRADHRQPARLADRRPGGAGRRAGDTGAQP